MAERLALYSTWYPGVERFLSDWATSLVRQTDKDFDLWIGVDGIDARAVALQLPLPSAPRFVAALPGESPGALRSRALGEIVAAGSAAVMVDSDDVLHPRRVEDARRALSESDVAGCALRIVDDAGRPTGAVFGPLPGESPESLLPRYNVFGMSNTAWRRDALAACLPVPAGCLLVDWLLATRAWFSGARLSFDPEPRMDYRQYAANTANVVPPFTPEHVQLAAGHVCRHYELLFDGGSIPEPYHSALAAARDRAERFRNAAGNPVTLSVYLEALNRLAPRYVWWWCVAHPDLEAVWNR